MKKILIVLMFVCSYAISNAQQRVLSEGSINYLITVTTNNKEPELADIFDGASLNVFIKNNKALEEMKSVLRNQSILFDSKSDSATILKESGDQKFMINLKPDDWKDYNKKYEDISFTITNDTKTIAGYVCKKAIGKLHTSDTTSMVVYFAPELTTSAKGYDYQFRNLPGLPLEYEVQNGNLKVKYTASKVNFASVPLIKFDVPKSGYRILDYQKTKPK